MKNIFILLISMTCSLVSNGQTSQTHLPASKSIIGIWKQTGATNIHSGKLVDVKSGNYKVINADGTFFTFVDWGIIDRTKDTTIGQYGTYEITSDSTLVEHVIKHMMDPNLNGKDGAIKFKLVNENTLMMAWSYGNTKWVNEKWTRLPLSMP